MKNAPLTLPVVLILPLPVFNVPATLTPVPVTTNTLALPTADILTLPFAAGILTLLLPFASGPIKLVADKLPVILAPVVVIRILSLAANVPPVKNIILELIAVPIARLLLPAYI